ncbi:MAG TPA: 50S ribosomal protein L21 [Sphingomicrobium sp.]|nr:50S ribosomal protein L21 [Sphingomicrobium sp.]
MFAVVRTGGKQYRVHPGDKIVVEKLDGQAGDRITLSDVLIAGDGGDLKSTSGLTVAAEIVAQAKGEKVTVFKKRRRHNYRRKKGHRQLHTILQIVAIGDHKHEPSKSAAAEKKSSAKAEAGAAAPAKKKAGTEPKVEERPTENPAPQNQAQANPPAESSDAPAKPPAGKKSASGGKPAKSAPAKAEGAASTRNAAPAKGAAKKSAPKAKK